MGGKRTRRNNKPHHLNSMAHRFEKFIRGATIAVGVTAGAELRDLDPELQIPTAIAEQLKAYQEQKTALTHEELREQLEFWCTFVDKAPVIYQIHVPSSTEGNLFAPGGFIEQELNSVDHARHPGELLIVEVDFDTIRSLETAFYLPGFDAIFINQSSGRNGDRKRAAFEDYLYLEVIQCAKRDERLQYAHAHGGHRTSGLFVFPKSVLKDLDDRYSRWVSGSNHSLGSLPRNWLMSHQQDLSNVAIRYRYDKAVESILTETSLPHEAFHSFFNKQLNREGYEGPSYDELVVLAMSQLQRRYGDSVGDIFTYYNEPNFLEHVRKVTGKDLPTDPEHLKDFAKKISSLNHDDPLHAELEKIVNEYLARVFCGLQGGTPEVVKNLIAMEMQKIGIAPEAAPLPEGLEDMFFKPSKEERAAFAKMKWHGKPILQLQH